MHRIYYKHFVHKSLKRLLVLCYFSSCAQKIEESIFKILFLASRDLFTFYTRQSCIRNVLRRVICVLFILFFVLPLKSGGEFLSALISWYKSRRYVLCICAAGNGLMEIFLWMLRLLIGFDE